MLVRAREDLLEDVLGVLVREPVRLGRDRVDITGEALDEDVPGLGLAGAAARDQICVGQRIDAHEVAATAR